MLPMPQLRKEFTSSEHQSLGDVKLPGLSEDFRYFVLKSGVTLTFGEIIALAGDFFGIALKPVSLGSTEQDRRKRFLEVYATLDNSQPEIVYKITNVIGKEYKDAKLAVARKKSEANAINKIVVDETKIYLDSTNFNYLNLSEHNLDHFNQQAHIAFQTGYKLAIEAAVAASNLSDVDAQQEQLKYAYSLLAFSCHFLTDLFASGHIRTCRADLENQFGPEIGSLVSIST